MPFRLGGDGSDGTIDCIHMVMAGLADLGIPHTPNQPSLVRLWRQGAFEGTTTMG